MQSLILHNYDFSNYAEKIRRVLGFKQLRWGSVEIPSVAPKPELQALTGGYRRTPVLQIGADLYCDTRRIMRALEALKPLPTLYPAKLSAQAEALSYWAETQLFRPIALYVSGSSPDVFPLSLQADRAQMRGVPVPSATAMQRAAKRNAPLVRIQLPRIEQMLQDGRRWILGDDVSVADFSVYHALWFMTARTQRHAGELEPFQAIGGWMRRMDAMGHGEREPMTASEALNVAAQAEPALPLESHLQREDPALGSTVRVRPSDYGQETVEGELVHLSDEAIAVRRMDPKLGVLVVHFPRLGYDLR